MPIGISTLCTFGKTYSVLDELLDLKIEVLEILEDWKDRMNKSRIKKLREIKRSNGISYTVHSPILDVDIAASNARFRTLSNRMVMESIRHASEIEAELVVVHPGIRSPLEYLVPKINWELNKESLRKIIAYGEDIGVKVTVENMPSNTPCFLQTATEFQALVNDGLPLYMTLDVGHANTVSQLRSFMETMKDRIIHIHLHDNKGTNDDHMVVGAGTIDWDLLRSNLNLNKITAVVEANNLKDGKASLIKARQLFNS
jgi:sugar phosphate isomerase/epimerase